MQSDVKLATKQLLKDTFEIDEHLLDQEDASFRTLGLDSLDIADLIVILEKRAKKRIPIENFLAVRTVGDVYKVVGEVMKNV